MSKTHLTLVQDPPDPIGQGENTVRTGQIGEFQEDSRSDRQGLHDGVT